MQELRWILLGIGLVVILSIWVWGRWSKVRAERAQQAAAEQSLVAEPGFLDVAHRYDEEHFGPALGADAGLERDGEFAQTVVLPPLSTLDARRAPVDPPIITINDLPADFAQVELARESFVAPPMTVIAPLRPTPPTLETPVRAAPVQPRPVPVPPPAPRPPSPPPPRHVTPWPLPTTAAAPAAPTATVPAPVPITRPATPRPVEPPMVTEAVSVESESTTAPARAQAKQDRHQRILALRIVVLSGRLASGVQLAQAFHAEGLEYGRYRIFHRMAEDERPVFSVASLVEPGSFDPDTMATERYLGVSMFAIFPGPLPAPETFDQLLAVARRLSDRLGAVLQDDTGHQLSAERLLALRADLVQFESLTTSAHPGRPPG